jgi:copper chaperone CopZ
VQIPIGRVLIASGLVNEEFLQTALHAQLLIRDGLVSVEQAVHALKAVAEENISLKEALQTLNLSPQFSSDTGNLAELLLDSNIVTEEQIEAALLSSSQSGIPLSGALILQGALSQSFFPNLLRAQQQLKSKMPRDQIVDELKSSFLVWLKAEESLTQKFAENKDRLQPNDQIEAPGITAEPTPGIVSGAGVSVGAHKSNGKQNLDAQADNLERQAEHDLEPAPRLVDLLKSSGVINQSEIQKAWEKMLDDPTASGGVFHAMGLLDEPTLQLSQRCQNLIKRRLITYEEGVRALRSARSGVLKFEDALQQELDSERARFFAKSWRQNTLVRAIGGAAVGVLAAAFILGRRR